MAENFARGGVVPGPDDGDRVPAMLEPSGFILTARQVELLGGDERVRKLREALRGESDGRDG